MSGLGLQDLPRPVAPRTPVVPPRRRRLPTAVVPAGIEARPAPWGFGHSRRLVDTAGRFLDRLRVSGPGLHRGEDRLSATSVVPGTARTVSPSGARR